MKFEFRPDFKDRPRFKAVWPRLREFFKGLGFRPERRGPPARAIIALAFAIALLAVLLALLRRR